MREIEPILNCVYCGLPLTVIKDNYDFEHYYCNKCTRHFRSQLSLCDICFSPLHLFYYVLNKNSGRGTNFAICSNPCCHGYSHKNRSVKKILKKGVYQEHSIFGAGIIKYRNTSIFRYIYSDTTEIDLYVEGWPRPIGRAAWQYPFFYKFIINFMKVNLGVNIERS